MSNEDTATSIDEATLRSKGFIKCNQRLRYLLKERVGLVPDKTGKKVEGITARIIMIWSERRQERQKTLR